MKLERVDIFSDLNYDLYTTDFVFEELRDAHKKSVSRITKNKKLKIIDTVDPSDLRLISIIYENNKGLSFEDCSVWYYSKKLAGVLLTGDGRLRKKAAKDGIEVRGIIFVFDELLEQGLISFPIAIEKIENLLMSNYRLPKREIEKRIENWKLEKHVD